MITRKTPLNINNLGYGAAAEMFDAELQRVIANLADPNAGKDTREINLKVSFKPGDYGDVIINVKCSSKLSAIKPFETAGYFGYDGEAGEIHEVQRSQMELPLTTPDSDQTGAAQMNRDDETNDYQRPFRTVK
jgi:hypothetical protein